MGQTILESTRMEHYFSRKTWIMKLLFVELDPMQGYT